MLSTDSLVDDPYLYPLDSNVQFRGDFVLKKKYMLVIFQW